MHKYSGSYLEMLNSQLTDPSSLATAIQISTSGEISRDQVNLNIEQVDHGLFNIESNVPNEIVRDAAFLMSRGTGEIFNSANFNGTLSVQYDSSNYSEEKITRLIANHTKNESQIKTFHEKILENHFDLRTTMESEQKHFQEFIEIWRKSQKFKSWIADQPMDKDLLPEYIKAVRSIDWLDKIAPRNSRFILFNGGGLLLDMIATGGLGTIAGLGLSAFDHYLLDMLLKKWKPDQFIEGEYKDFLNLRNGAN